MNTVEELDMRPLSNAQLGVWVAQMLDPRNPLFNVAEYLEILGPVDPELFATAVRRVVAETDALHLRFTDTNEGPRQCLAPDPGWMMPLIDLSAELNSKAAAESWMKADIG